MELANLLAIESTREQASKQVSEYARESAGEAEHDKEIPKDAAAEQMDKAAADKKVLGPEEMLQKGEEKLDSWLGSFRAAKEAGLTALKGRRRG